MGLSWHFLDKTREQEIYEGMTCRKTVRAENLVFDYWGAELQRDSKPTQFSEDGYVLFDMSPEYLQSLMGFFDPEKEIEYRQMDVDETFHQTPVPEGFEKKYNQTHKFFSAPKSIQGLERYMAEIAPIIESELSGSFKIVNVRATAITSNGPAGPTSWHFDGGPRFLRKIMIYPKPLNTENGTLEIYTRKGKKVRLESNGPLAILCDVSILKHRGVPGKLGSVRPMIEITLSPSEKTDTTLRFAGQAAREIKLPVNEIPEHLKALYYGLKDRPEEPPVKKHRSLLSKINHRFGFMRENHWRSISNRAKNLNIGPELNFNSWVNLQGAPFPISSGTIQKVHIAIDSDENILKEAKRVLAKDGKLIIKSKKPLKLDGFKIISQDRLYIGLRFLSIPDIFKNCRGSRYYYAINP